MDAKAVKYSFERSREDGRLRRLLHLRRHLHAAADQVDGDAEPDDVRRQPQRRRRERAPGLGAARRLDRRQERRRSARRRARRARSTPGWPATSPAAGPFILKSYEAEQAAPCSSRTRTSGRPASAEDASSSTGSTSDPTLLLQARSGAADVTIGLSKQSARRASRTTPRSRSSPTTRTLAEWLGLRERQAAVQQRQVPRGGLATRCRTRTSWTRSRTATRRCSTASSRRRCPSTTRASRRRAPTTSPRRSS